MAAVAWYSGDGQSLHVKGKIIESIATLAPESKFSKATAVFEIDRAKVKSLQASWEWLQACEGLTAKLCRESQPQRDIQFRALHLILDRGYKILVANNRKSQPL